MKIEKTDIIHSLYNATNVGWDEINNLESSKLVDNQVDVKTTEFAYPSTDSGLTIPISKNKIRPWFTRFK